MLQVRTGGRGNQELGHTRLHVVALFKMPCLVLLHDRYDFMQNGHSFIYDVAYGPAEAYDALRLVK